MTTITAAARAAYEASPWEEVISNPDGTRPRRVVPWDELPASERERYILAQRAAFAAVRVPSEAMERAVSDPRRANGSALSKGFADTWQAAIDALLSEEG